MRSFQTFASRAVPSPQAMAKEARGPWLAKQGIERVRACRSPGHSPELHSTTASALCSSRNRCSGKRGEGRDCPSRFNPNSISASGTGSRRAA